MTVCGVRPELGRYAVDIANPSRERKRRGSHSPFNNAVDPFGIRNGRVYLRAEDRMRSDDKASAVHFLMKRLHESCKSLTQPL